VRQDDRERIVADAALVDEMHADAIHRRAKLRQVQVKGLLPKELDPRHLLLSLLGLTAFPLAFPQFTRLVTGMSPRDQAFRKRRIEFLRAFAAWLRPERDEGRLSGRARHPGRR